ncbi:hypothetical protein VJ918_02775 [Adlercreutzia sp. R21]|uniref:DUF4367 domain-containing protein n=1 Tax=Adlercreutzia wanghongyangiae TaxID=3111451 RepID=A0ABU6IHZ8_9ACTN|nr:hypothetical protein [Adlercreutzia sp. R21]MEC4176035.1 hypothetical protein [Adlercreutzia sp. R7]MEC4183726.1 hypothetical protein [Adlercreutzia sp. R21]
MNEKRLDDLIASRAAASRPSASFEAAIDHALGAVENASDQTCRGDSGNRRWTCRPRRRTAGGRRVPAGLPRAAAVAVAVAVGVGGSAWAAEKLGFTLQQTDANQMQVSPRMPEEDNLSADAQTIDEYELTFSYIPASLPDHLVGTDSGGFSNNDGFEGWSQFAPSIEYYTYYLDTTEPAVFSSVENGEAIEVAGHEAVLMEFDYGMRYAQRSTQTRLYVAFPDERRVVHLQTSNAELADELVPIAEGMSLKPTGCTVPLEFQITWSQAVENARIDAEDAATRARDGGIDDAFGALCGITLTDEQMGPLRTVGETFPLPGNEAIAITVESVKFHDDGSLVDREQMPASWRSLIDKDGSLAEGTLAYVSYGNGQSDTDTVVKEEAIPLKLVEVSVSLANESTETQDDIRCMLSLESAMHENGTWTRYQRVDECPEADEAQCNLGVGTGLADYVERLDDGSIGRMDRRLGSLDPGETREVRYLWLVLADETDKLLLDIDIDGMGNYADGTFGQRLVDIRAS